MHRYGRLAPQEKRARFGFHDSLSMLVRNLFAGKYSMAKTKGGRKHGTRKPEYQSYIFRVDNPEVSYSLAIDRGKWAEGPYREHPELNVRRTMVMPERLQGRQGTLTFLGDRRITNELERPIESRLKPIAVGSLTVWGENTSYLGSLPHDAF